MKTGNFVKRTDIKTKYSELLCYAFSIVSPIRSLDLICECEYDYMNIVEQCGNKISEYASLKKISSQQNSDGEDE